MNIDNFKSVCVIGWGRSGKACLDLLLKLGKKVKVSEARDRSYFSRESIDELNSLGVDFEFSSHSEAFIKDCQLIVVSPGVDVLSPSLERVINNLELPCVGEIELACWLTKASCIAITGTNGKSTTTQLTYELLKQKRKRVFIGGNIGIPFSSFVLDTRSSDIVVLELSSFQLETIISFRPHVAALLNITPDHLDRYRDFRSYLRAKLNIFRNQSGKDFAVVNKNDNFNLEREISLKSKILYFSNEFSNENFSCAYRIGSVYGLNKIDCQRVFSQFKGLNHRCQVVRTLAGVTFINDSKATNPSSTAWALRNLKGPIILLAGGKDKGLDYSLIRPYLKRIKKLNLFGEASEVILGSLKPATLTKTFKSFEEAVVSSFKEAQPGDTVLLSPMCASFDMFSDYQERGNKFVEIVNRF